MFFMTRAINMVRPVITALVYAELLHQRLKIAELNPRRQFQNATPWSKLDYSYPSPFKTEPRIAGGQMAPSCAPTSISL